MRNLPVLAVATAALALGCGRPLLSAQAQVERITVTTAPISFPDLRALGPLAAGLGLDPSHLTTTVTLSYDLGDVPVDEKGVTTELELTGFTLHLRPSGPNPPDNLRSVYVLLVDPRTAATTLVASYVKGAAPTPADVTFAVPGTELMPFISQKKLEARLQLTFGDPANLPNAFQATTELACSAQITVDYTKL